MATKCGITDHKVKIEHTKIVASWPTAPKIENNKSNLIADKVCYLHDVTS